GTSARPYSYRLRKKERLFRTLGAVLGTALLAVLHAGGIQRTTHGVVTDTRKVLHTAATNQNHAVFLQVVAFTTDVRGNLVTVGQTHTADLTQCGVGFFRGGGVHAGAHATTLGAVLQRGYVGLFDDTLARLTHQLVDSCHLLAPLMSFDRNKDGRAQRPAKFRGA